MWLCPTGDLCHMDCTGSQGWLLKMSLWPHQWSWGLLVQLKCWKNLFEFKSPSSLPAHPTWLVAAQSHLPDQLLCAQTSPRTESTQSSKFICKFPASKTFCFQLGEGFTHLCGLKIFLCRAGALRSSPGFLCFPGCCCLWQCSLLGVELPWRPQSSSVWMEMKLNGYSGSTGEF